MAIGQIAYYTDQAIVNTMKNERLTQMRVDELSRQSDFVAFGSNNNENDVQEQLRGENTEGDDESEDVQEQLEYY